MPAAKGNCYNPDGRPKKPIDWVQFEKLCGVLCTQEEIADILHIDKHTLIDRTQEHYEEAFSTVYKRFSSSGKCSLRRNQFTMSKKNTAMAIWLGKQWLGQKDTTPDHIFPEEVVKPFVAIMSQLASLQSERKIEDSSISNEAKSA
jgi:hypothetical protein